MTRSLPLTLRDCPALCAASAIALFAILLSAGQALAEGDGWTAQTYSLTRAISHAAVTDKMAHTGKRSLLLSVRLNGKVKGYREGEAFVDLRFNPPAEANAPVNMSHSVLSAWVYCPAGLEGPRSNPNGLRLFVKDNRWHSEYGTWTHLAPGKWVQVSLSPTLSAPATGYVDKGFDPRMIISVGVSIAVGGGSSARFIGEMAIDDVTWGPGPVKYGFED